MSDPNTVTIRLPDASVREVPRGSTVREILQAWRPEESATYLAAILDGVPVDLDRRVETGAPLSPLTFEDRAGRDILQHSAAHLVAKALTEIIPEAKPTHGPPTDEGFFYDFDVRPLTPENLEEMRRVINRTVRAGDRFQRREISKAEAEELFAANPHKLRYIREAPEGEMVSVYSTGDFVDLCRGPHVPDVH
ncbi:threonyl-tRNA synthetase, partial [mine drainage metagenome]